MDRNIRTVADVLALLDGLFVSDADRWSAGGAGWWDGFYADRSKAVPFFVAKPDESLESYLRRGLIAPGRALDVGCGPGRNAVRLAAAGFEVDAVDLSPTAVAWAEERARAAGAEVRFRCGDVFELAQGELTGPYDLVYDSGCFYHLPPHRRISYLSLLDRVLAPGGFFALSCFAAGAMGSELSDVEFYREGRLFGGLAYTAESLRRIFADLTEVELRRMRDEPPDSACFGEPFLWTALFRRPVCLSARRAGGGGSRAGCWSGWARSGYEEVPMPAEGFTTCLWFDGQAEEAAHYYLSIFKRENSRLGRIGRYTEAGPGPVGSVLVVEFELNGQKFVGLNGGPQFKFNEAISFQIYCADQAEVDYYWSRLSEGGEEGSCGWLKDRYGVSWQVVPSELMDMIHDPDPEKAKRATEAMLPMGKLDIAALRRAYQGA